MADKNQWPPCPACGGKVTGSYNAYLAHIKKVNKDHPDIEEENADAAIVTAEKDPSGGVGICSNCGQAVAAEGSKDAALTEPPAAAQMPAESPEHMDTVSGSSEIATHEVDPDAVPEPAS